MTGVSAIKIGLGMAGLGGAGAAGFATSAAGERDTRVGLVAGGMLTVAAGFPIGWAGIARHDHAGSVARSGDALQAAKLVRSGNRLMGAGAAGIIGGISFAMGAGMAHSFAR